MYNFKIYNIIYIYIYISVCFTEDSKKASLEKSTFAARIAQSVCGTLGFGKERELEINLWAYGRCMKMLRSSKIYSILLSLEHLWIGSCCYNGRQYGHTPGICWVCFQDFSRPCEWFIWSRACNFRSGGSTAFLDMFLYGARSLVSLSIALGDGCCRKSGLPSWLLGRLVKVHLVRGPIEENALAKSHGTTQGVRVHTKRLGHSKPWVRRDEFSSIIRSASKQSAFSCQD